ncbi:hypothetical protein Nepgr_027040 [Nepenthes gracilis]|uniref:DNA polymerase alpha catalytic subunit N-terminal domain-containing protein n=1 Tax=Nepenthes gracilis TaxID=150966 RepID=A0AAD3Y0X5_NEPGR|nr:hypothetical protein Nepgr_027040 [Nepenthes gracilis]
MEVDQSTEVGRRRSRGANATARAEALERLRAFRRGERRPQNSYQVKIEAPIYDTVDEDEYSALVAKRRSEFSNFVVDDGDAYANLGYRDDGEEEDWTRAGFPLSSDESDGGESERSKKKKPEKKEKDPQQKKPYSSPLSSAAAIMGKQRISSMFTSSVFKRRSDDKAKLCCDNIVDDVIAEFAPDEGDREKRKRGQLRKSRLGAPNCAKIEKMVMDSVDFVRME